MGITGRSTFAQVFGLPPEAHTWEWYCKQGSSFVTAGEDCIIDMRDIDTYSGLWYGQKRLECKCLKTYKNGALFATAGINSCVTFFLNWWEVFKTVR